MNDNVQYIKKSKRVVRVACQGGRNALIIQHDSQVRDSCHAAHETADNSCRYGCLGLGECISVCKFSALKINEQGLIEVDEDKCTGCGMCVKVCPRHVLKNEEREKCVHVRCNAPGLGKDKRLSCRTACIGCTNCKINCPSGALNIIDGLAVINYELCCNCRKCIDCCPSCLDYSKVIKG